jgi:hypothetical protein
MMPHAATKAIPSSRDGVMTMSIPAISSVIAIQTTCAHAAAASTSKTTYVRALVIEESL